MLENKSRKVSGKFINTLQREGVLRFAWIFKLTLLRHERCWFESGFYGLLPASQPLLLHGQDDRYLQSIDAAYTASRPAAAVCACSIPERGDPVPILQGPEQGFCQYPHGQGTQPVGSSDRGAGHS